MFNSQFVREEAESSFHSHSSFKTTIYSVSSEGERAYAGLNGGAGSDNSTGENPFFTKDSQDVIRKREKKRDIWASMKSSDIHEPSDPKMNYIQREMNRRERYDYQNKKYIE